MREILCLKFMSFFDNHETEIKEKDLMISSEYAYHVTSILHYPTLSCQEHTE